MSKNGMYYLCKVCFSKIKRNPENKGMKDMFQWEDFPESLLEKVKNVSKTKEVLLRNVNTLPWKTVIYTL